MKEEEFDLVHGMETLDEDGIVSATDKLIGEGYTDHEIEALLQQGMHKVEQKFEHGDYFLGDLVVAGLFFKTVLEMLPSDEDAKPQDDGNGRILIGVMAEDIHDIGKDIVVQVLRTENFDVYDLGVDVPFERFMSAIDEYKPDIVALSGVMGKSSEAMEDVVRAMDEKGLHNQTPVIIGGSCASEFLRNRIGADAYAKGPVDTMLYCKQFMKTRHGDETGW